MQSFTILTSVAAPLLRNNIDTDTIIAIHRQVGTNIRGKLGQWCLGSLRYRPDGTEDPDFVLNRAPFRGASIVLAGQNFGCGSSREGAVWALQEYGVSCVIAPSFGDIFFNNCFQNGLLPVVLPEPTVIALAAEAQTGAAVTIDLVDTVVVAPSGQRYPFTVEARRRTALLKGLDEIGTTLAEAGRITSFQTRDAAARPWIYHIGEAS
ncbi:3-isopropylmalate dehydratase small subunit [Acidisphaera sp. L21]|uniref:3-isopropylmalate dehydratase small subunit n=1 Tax=Acidisphaera sp. L21 TaxID=1641851 RepID=UPI00131C3486|nr:3-isopropylmalate dehydratase small subunit [Acidisphaera sp. L21]